MPKLKNNYYQDPIATAGQSLVKIGKAAKILGISIKTLRRWEANGIFRSIRTAGGTRFYSLIDLKNFQLQKAEPKKITPSPKLIKIGEAATSLNVSIKTLRRWEQAGKIISHRTPGGTRLYDLAVVKKIITAPSLIKTKNFTKPESSNYLPIFEARNIPSALENTKATASPEATNPILKNKPIGTYLLIGFNIVVICFLVSFWFLNNQSISNLQDKLNVLGTNSNSKEASYNLPNSQSFNIDQIVKRLKDSSLVLANNSDHITFKNDTLSGILNWPLTGSDKVVDIPDASTTLIGIDTVQTITNKYINASNNKISNLPNSSLSNSFITINTSGNLSGGGNVALGGTINLTDSSSQVMSLTGTSNQINISSKTGDITLSLPQNISADSAPTFSALALGPQTAMVNPSQSALNVLSNVADSSTHLVVFQNTSAGANYGNGGIDSGIVKILNLSTSTDGITTSNPNVSGLFVESADSDTITTLIRNTNTGIKMTNVGTLGAQADPGVLTIEGNGGISTDYNLITAYNSTIRSDAAAVFRVRADGTIYGEGSFQTSGADYAEFFKTDDPTIDQGDLVSVDLPNTSGSEIRKANSFYDNKILGIVSTKPGFIGNNPNGQDGNSKSYKLVAISGKVPLKVSTQNGPIQKGDYLTSSPDPGIAVKATHAGSVIGKALEDYSADSVGKIAVFINVSYADPNNLLANLIVDEDGTLITPKLGVKSLSINQALIVRGNLQVKSQQALLEDQIASASSQLAETKELSQKAIDNLSNLSSQIENFLASFTAKNTESTSSGQILIDANILLASDSAKLANLDSSGKLSGLHLTVSSLHTFDATISGTLKALGDSFLGKTTIAGDLTVDGSFSITDGNTLNALPVLYIQRSSLASLVNFFNGVVTISKDGIVSANKIELSDRSLGQAKIAKGETSITIQNPTLTPRSKVFVTATLPVAIGVVKQDFDNHNFIVSIGQPLTDDLTFNWWVVDQK